MLKTLKLQGVGPGNAMALDFGERLNVITGDNGLGKSFLLDIAFWALTGRWPAEVNPKLSSGGIALPRKGHKGVIQYSFAGDRSGRVHRSHFDLRSQSWDGALRRPANPGLVLYAMADGSFAVWDPHRNYWRAQTGGDPQLRRPGYVFTPQEVWDGLLDDAGRPLCNGLIRDLASWQRERGQAWRYFEHALEAMSPGSDEPLRLGELTRISLDDARDMPTLSMPYGVVALVHASSGVRRILAWAYLLVWAWEEHLKAGELLGEKSSGQVTFLIDEIESHLHPRWQFTVVRSLLGVMDMMAPDAVVQLITATHSPQVLASLEPIFDSTRDAWFDLDYDRSENKVDVVLSQRPFEPHGTVSNWLTSDAFDLPSDRPPDIASLLDEASTLAAEPQPAQQAMRAMHDRLLAVLNPRDAFLFRWRALAERKGWQP